MLQRSLELFRRRLVYQVILATKFAVIAYLMLVDDLVVMPAVPPDDQAPWVVAQEVDDQFARIRQIVLFERAPIKEKRKGRSAVAQASLSRSIWTG